MIFDFLVKLSTNYKKITPYIIAGPRFDILLDYDSEEHLFDVIYDKLEPIDYGLDIGCGVEFQIIHNTKSLIELRYSPTITTSYEDEYYTIKNTSFEILTGIKF